MNMSIQKKNTRMLSMSNDNFLGDICIEVIFGQKIEMQHAKWKKNDIYFSQSVRKNQANIYISKNLHSSIADNKKKENEPPVLQ